MSIEPTTQQKMLLLEATRLLNPLTVTIPSSALDVNTLFAAPLPQVRSPISLQDYPEVLNSDVLRELPWQKGQPKEAVPLHWYALSSRDGTASHGIWRRYIDDQLVDEIRVAPSKTSRDGVGFYDLDGRRTPSRQSGSSGDISIFVQIPALHPLVEHQGQQSSGTQTHYYLRADGEYVSTRAFRLTIFEENPRTTRGYCIPCCHCVPVNQRECVCRCHCQRIWSFVLEDGQKITGNPTFEDGKCAANLSTKFTTLAAGYACEDGVAVALSYKPGIGKQEYLDQTRDCEVPLLAFVTRKVKTMFQAGFTVRTPECTPILECTNPFDPDSKGFLLKSS